MPEVSFGFPFGGAANPHAERVRVEHIAWVQEMRLVEEGAGLRDYVALDIPWAAACMYPQADRDDLLVLANWLALPAVFDEQLTRVRADPGEAASLGRELMAIPYQPAGTPPALQHPMTEAWVQVWELLCDGMTDQWRDRFASSWARSCAARVRARLRPAAGQPMKLDEYLAHQRLVMGSHQVFAVERSRGFELPAVVGAHALVHRLRTAAADVVGWMNDILLAPRAQERGDNLNLIAVLERERGYSRQAAFDEALWMARQQMQVYLQTEAGLARVWDELWLTSDQRDSAAAAVEGIQHWIAGNHVWASSLALDAVVPRDE